VSDIFKWFGDVGNAAFVASLLSVIAIIVSILAFRKSLKTQNRLVDIEEVREKDRLAEKNKANLTAKIIKEALPRSGSIKIDTNYYLQIENKGSSEARDVKVVLDGKPLLEHPTILKNIEEITQVGPNTDFRYLLVLSMQGRPPSNIEIEWEDDSGEPGNYSTTLTL